MDEPLTVGTDTTLRWASGVRYRRDETRDRWMIVAPERILVPEGPGADIARLIDGDRSVDDIVELLADEYDAPRQTIAEETMAFLQQLADQRYVVS